MAKPIYRGRFLSERDTEYTLYIYREGMSPNTPDWLVFGEVPAQIEWNEVDKIEPVQGSALTVTLLSEADRQYIDLYSVQTGEVWCELYRDGALYWRGSLDTEMYEEPYYATSDYEATFSFSDFGALDRVKWTDRDTLALEQILTACLEAASLSYDMLQTMISTTVSGYDLLKQCYVNGENFFDEDGEAMTMHEVLEAILQPLALRIVQKGGTVYLFDLNALSGAETASAYWLADDQMLGTDNTYNNVKVTFSPYAETTLMDGSIEHDDTLQDRSGAVTYMIDKRTDINEEVDGFTFLAGAPADDDELPFTLGGQAQLYRIDQIYSGSDEAGIFMMRRGNGIIGENKPSTDIIGSQAWLSGGTDGLPEMSVVTNNSPIISMPAVHVNYAPKYKMKIELSMLVDARYNPFETADGWNCKNNYNEMKNLANFCYVPIRLILTDGNGTKWHYSNSSVVKSASFKNSGAWLGGEGAWGDAWLCFYDLDDRRTASGFDGWSVNKQCIGLYTGTLPRLFEKQGDGEFISMPPLSGWVELQIGAGIWGLNHDGKAHAERLANLNRWLLYKDVKLSIVKSNGTDIDSNDQEDSAWINSAAQEDYEIETTVGTLQDGSLAPSARGVVLNPGGYPISAFTRAGVTDRLERLLIGTVYSQYAKRKATLSGTMLLQPSFAPLTDAAMEGVRFVMLSEIQDLAADSSEITMAEFAPDDYTGVEYKSKS